MNDYLKQLQGLMSNPDAKNEFKGARIFSEEARKKMSISAHSRYSNPEQYQLMLEERQTRVQNIKKISNSAVSLWQDPEYKQKQMALRNTPEHRAKLKEAAKNRPYVTCVHCEVKSQNVSVMNRWHNDNCKHKKD
jgi:hypothetical protein